jgi:3,4-dihydroxy 2-butanone 4-phosphate synthase/GTP cyclohydrolase II
MKLSQWFEQTKRQKRAFANDIGVTPQMISAYCKGDVWPSKETMKAIARETGGAVTPNDWADLSEVAQ